MVDLGRWFRETYRISRPLGPEDVPDSFDPDEARPAQGAD